MNLQAKVWKIALCVGCALALNGALVWSAMGLPSNSATGELKTVWVERGISAPAIVESPVQSTSPFGIQLLEGSSDSKEAAIDAFAELIAEKASSYEKTIWVPEEYVLTVNDVERAIYKVGENPTLFFLGQQYAYSYYDDSSIANLGDKRAAVVYLSYAWENPAKQLTDPLTTAEKAAMDDALVAFAQKKAEALSWVNASMTDVQKAQALHDYLVRTCCYDSRAWSGTEPWLSHNAYGALVSKVCVCQGYAMAYKLLLNEMGVGCIYVSSDPMNHGWNMVSIEGSWYHVDVTWDDPTYSDGTDDGFDGSVSHEYFLKSDATMLGTGLKTKYDHYDWSSPYSAAQDWPAFEYPEYKSPAEESGEEPEPPHVHDFDEWVVTKEATCTAVGSKARDCSRCDASETAEIPAKGHTAVTDVAVAATCTKAGLTEGSHCLVCGEEIVACKTVDALGHDFGEWVVTKEATIAEEGEESRTCSRCDASETKVIPKLEEKPSGNQPQPGSDPDSGSGSDPDPDSGSDPDPDFGSDPVVKPDPAPVHVHSWVTVKGYAAKIGIAGKTDGVKCACGVWKTAQTAIAAKRPTPVKLTKLVKGTKLFTAKWAKSTSANATGYQVRYSLKKSMASAKTVTVKGYKVTSKKVKSLKSKKTYYVQVRVYKVVNGKKWFSSWSAKKFVKVA